MSSGKWKKALLKSLGTLACVLLVSACGGSNSTGSINTPTAPKSPGGVIPTVPNTDSNLPDFSKGAQVLLTDTTNFTGVKDIMAPDVFYPAPVTGTIGNPLVLLKFPARSGSIEGTFFIEIEDRLGAWAAQIPSFTGASTQSTSQQDMIFADNLIVVRVVSNLVGDQMQGTIYYRVRASGDTQCMVIGTLDTVTPCKNGYINVGNPNVKTFGTFTSSYSSWAQ